MASSSNEDWDQVLGELQQRPPSVSPHFGTPTVEVEASNFSDSDDWQEIYDCLDDVSTSSAAPHVQPVQNIPSANVVQRRGRGRPKGTFGSKNLRSDLDLGVQVASPPSEHQLSSIEYARLVRAQKTEERKNLGF